MPESDVAHRIEYATFRVLAQAESLEDAAPQIVEGICGALGWDYGVAWTTEQSGHHLASIADWSNPGLDLASFARVTRDSTFLEGEGLPGRVWSRGGAVWVEDVTVDDNFPRTPFAVECGLHGAFAFPLFVRDRFFGVFEFFSREVTQPDTELLELFKALSTYIGDFVERGQMEAELEFQKALLEYQGEAALDGIGVLSTDLRILYYNQRILDMFDITEEELRFGDATPLIERLIGQTADPTSFTELADVILNDHEASYRVEARLSDGRVIDVWTAPVRSPEGQTYGRAVYARDITEQREREERLRREEEWTTFLAEATGILSESLETQVLTDRLSELCVPRLADHCEIQLTDAAGPSVLTDDKIVVPIVARSKTLGAITLVSAESGRRYDGEDLRRAEELASRAAFPIENARLYAASRQVSQTLQKSFLPPGLPEIPGVDVSARYFAAGEGELIGGDFYDAFRTDKGRWSVVLGDVSGKGLEAATVTALARHTIRGAAVTTPRPSEALRILNTALLEQNQTDRFCTAVYATVEPRFARVRVTASCGGHPAPYVIRNDGVVEPVTCNGTLLGFVENVSLQDTVVDLEFGDKFFIYTDGLLDIRQKGGMFGQEGLEKLLYECSKRGTESAAEHISQTIAELQQGRATDDIAFIILGVRSSVFDVRGRGRISQSD